MSQIKNNSPSSGSDRSREQSAYELPIERVLSDAGVDAKRGLSDSEIGKRRERFGFNQLSESPPEPWWKKFLGQFNDVMVWILLAAALISGVMGEWTDTAAIAAIVLLNAVLGYFQEERAERALAALQSLAAPLAKVIRDGTLATIPGRELLPGDIIELEAGDNVPADVRLLQAFAVRVQEASLTGESVPVEKQADVVLPAETSLADRRNMAYMSTVLANGQGRGVVVAIGMKTEIGRIAGLLQHYEREPTPLQKQLAKVGQSLVVVCLVLVGVIFLLSLLRGEKLLTALLTSVSLAVAAVPEGLPAVVTMALALGLQRMVKRNALIRKLPSVETLGCVTVICSDKTGTLTRNEMTVREVVAGSSRFRVTGAGYAPHGEFLELDTSGERPLTVVNDDLNLVLRIGALCNHAQLQPGETSNSWKIVGDPTEAALVVLARKAGINRDGQAMSIVDELPFDSERKAMSVVLREAAGGVVQYTKGAPESVLPKCRQERRGGEVVELTDERRVEILSSGQEMASRALRVLACGYRLDVTTGAIEECDLIFAGLFGMIDPPRDEVKAAVVRCREAGIRPVMITGDHPATATAIARELGIATESDIVVTGHELDSLSDDELANRAEQIAVYARVAPEHKLRVVRALKARGHVVAMTGDGVNDAPAVKAADIGIAMGITGTDVTRETAAMVLMDDNFTSIVNAVEEGRAIYDNIQKFLIFLLSCNVGEMLLMLVATLIGWPAPLVPVHLLWINLVTDGLPALALAMEPPEPDLMRRRPRRSNESMLSWSLAGVVFGQGALLAIVGLAAFGISYGHDGDVTKARTMTFCVVVYGELFRALAARSKIWTFWQLGPATNPYVFAAVAISALLQVSIIALPFTRPIFEASSHTPFEWLLLVLLALTPVTVIELVKLGRQFFHPTISRNALASGSDPDKTGR
jgi:Ca2+-transporting ATPase